MLTADASEYGGYGLPRGTLSTFYRVRAVNAYGVSKDSSVAGVTVKK